MGKSKPQMNTDKHRLGFMENLLDGAEVAGVPGTSMISKVKRKTEISYAVAERPTVYSFFL